MAFQNLITAVCLVTVFLNSKVTCRPLHMDIMKRQAETGVDASTILLRQIYDESLNLFERLTPVNDTELLPILTEMPIELDQLRLLCDVVAMEESVRLLNGSGTNNRPDVNISTIISEEIFPGKKSTITKELCLTQRLSKSKNKLIAQFLNLFGQLDKLLYNRAPISRSDSD